MRIVVHTEYWPCTVSGPVVRPRRVRVNEVIDEVLATRRRVREPRVRCRALQSTHSGSRTSSTGRNRAPLPIQHRHRKLFCPNSSPPRLLWRLRQSQRQQTRRRAVRHTTAGCGVSSIVEATFIPRPCTCRSPARRCLLGSIACCVARTILHCLTPIGSTSSFPAARLGAQSLHPRATTGSRSSSTVPPPRSSPRAAARHVHTQLHQSRLIRRRKRVRTAPRARRGMPRGSSSSSRRGSCRGQCRTCLRENLKRMALALFGRPIGKLSGFPSHDGPIAQHSLLRRTPLARPGHVKNGRRPRSAQCKG